MKKLGNRKKKMNLHCRYQKNIQSKSDKQSIKQPKKAKIKPPTVTQRSSEKPQRKLPKFQLQKVQKISDSEESAPSYVSRFSQTETDRFNYYREHQQQSVTQISLEKFNEYKALGYSDTKIRFIARQQFQVYKAQRQQLKKQKIKTLKDQFEHV